MTVCCLRDFIRSNDADGNENVKKKKQLRFNKQNNNFAGASHFFVHFFAPFAVLHHYDAKIEICSWLAYVYRVMGARGKFGEHDKNA